MRQHAHRTDAVRDIDDLRVLKKPHHSSGDALPENFTGADSVAIRAYRDKSFGTGAETVKNLSPVLTLTLKGLGDRHQVRRLLDCRPRGRIGGQDALEDLRVRLREGVSRGLGGV
jgi:hypothetical protein